MRPLRLVLICVVAACGPLEAQRPARATEGRRAAMVSEARRLVGEVEAAIRAGALALLPDSAHCDGGAGGLVGRLYGGPDGVVRKYQLEGGSEDSAGELTYYFDAAGTVRFAIARTNAVNGTRRVDRVYFDARGRPAQRRSELVEGPGYPGGFVIDTLIRPREDVRRLCEPEP